MQGKSTNIKFTNQLYLSVKAAFKTTYINANAKQIQAIYNYERSILNAHIEVVNQLSRIDNFTRSYETKAKEVEILTQSIDISIVFSDLQGPIIWKYS